MEILVLVVANLLVYNTRLRFVHKLISFHKTKRPIILGLVFSGIASIAIMWWYHPLLNILQTEQRSFLQAVSSWSYVSYIIYLLLTLSFCHILLARIRTREYIQAFFFVTTRWVISLLGIIWIIKDVALYYMFIAFGEETSKYFLGNILYQRFSITPRDIIVFALLSALWFAFLENIVYLISNQNVSLSLNKAGWLLLKRGILTTSVHAIFTWMIGMGIMFSLSHKNALFMWWWIVWWVLLHWIFNMTVVFNRTLLLPLFMIGSYYLLSYLLFQSDIIYKSTVASPTHLVSKNSLE